MYVTAHLVRSREGDEGINAFLHLHGAEFTWPEDPAPLADTTPGTVVSRRTDIPPGGNRVRSYLDVLAPDGTTRHEIQGALAGLSRDLRERRNPTVFSLGSVTIRFGVDSGLEGLRSQHLDMLSPVALGLLDQSSVPPQRDVSTLTEKKRYEKHKRLMLAHNKAILDHLQQIGAAIVGMKNQEPDSLGSGTCVRLGEHCLIATAAHVVAPYQDDELLLVMHQERTTWTPKIIGRGMDRDLDVAWIEIDPEVAGELDRRFITIDRLQSKTSHLANDLAIVYGFPGQRVQLLRKERGIGVQPVCFASQTLSDEKRPPGSDPQRDVYIEYPEVDLFGPDGGPMVGIPAPGLSGGGIWTAEVNRDGLWRPELCRLIAIEHSWSEWKYVRGTQIQHWLALVVHDFPELEREARRVSGPALQPT